MKIEKQKNQVFVFRGFFWYRVIIEANRSPASKFYLYHYCLMNSIVQQVSNHIVLQLSRNRGYIAIADESNIKLMSSNEQLFVIIEATTEMLINSYFCSLEKAVTRIYNVALMSQSLRQKQTNKLINKQTNSEILN